MPAFIDIADQWIQPLAEAPHDPSPAFHRWSLAEKDALALAQAARRPLLVRGEPGTGKSQLAVAAARYLGWQLQTVVIHPRYEPSDLLYHFDAVQRLADAQVPDRLRPDAAYWRPGPLWRALAPAEAAERCRAAAAAGPADAHVVADLPDPTRGQVVLIDEVDKADSDLPNSLLEVLGQRGFRVPGLGNLPVVQTTPQPPLVLVTTNEERDLPPAFLRRCVVLNLEAPAEASAYRAWLVARGEAHHGMQAPAARRIAASVLAQAADQLLADRARVQAAGLPAPGPAEYLDLLGALLELVPGSGAAATTHQLDLLRQLSAYAFLKHGQVDGHPMLAQTRDALALPPANLPT